MYTFETNYKNRNIIVLFLGQIEGSDHYLAEEISESFLNFYRPDAVLLLHPSYLNINSPEFEASIAQLERLGTETSVYIASFDKNASLDLKEHHKGILKIKKTEAATLRDKIIKSGLTNMAHNKKESLILSAPTGTIFCKPSGETYSEFIKASELASTCHEIQFIAFTLLKYAAKVENLRCIYIDTMSISSYVESLISYLTLFSSNYSREISYYSFNSYDGISSRPDENNGVFVIISASSSNNLSKKIKKEWGLTENQIVNFLSYRDSDEEKIKTVANIKELSEGKNPLEFSEKKLKIVGENFAVEASEAKPVIIKTTNSPQKIINEVIYPRREKETFSCNKVAYTETKEKHVTVDWLKEKDSIKAWLEKIAEWHIPANTASIIVDYRNPSINLLLDATISSVKTTLGHDIKGYGINEIDKIPKEKATIILTDAISTARQFIAVNRELRRAKHRGNRIFISPFALFESKKTFLSTKSTLEKGESGFDYKLLCKEVLYIGPSDLAKIWNKELEIIKKYNHPHWKSRSEHLETKSKGIANRIGSYTSSSTFDEFSREFAFWPDDYETSKTFSSSVYLTIACILQNMRSMDRSEPDSLNGHTYQARILSPDNFWRFNDALIQSCLWRAALYSELDYRGSSLTSRIFSDLVLKYIDESKNKKSDIVCDYLIALTIGKIKICKECIERIVTHGKSELDNDNPALEVIASIEEKFLPQEKSRVEAH